MDQTIHTVLSGDQLRAYDQMNEEQAARFAESWGATEADYLKKHCGLTSEQTKAAAKIIAGLPSGEGGPGGLAVGSGSTDAEAQLNARIQALAPVLSPEQLQKYREARMEEIKLYQASLKAFGLPDSANR